MKFKIGQVTFDFSDNSFRITAPIDKYEISMKITHLPQNENPLSVNLSIWQKSDDGQAVDNAE